MTIQDLVNEKLRERAQESPSLDVPSDPFDSSQTTDFDSRLKQRQGDIPPETTDADTYVGKGRHICTANLFSGSIGCCGVLIVTAFAIYCVSHLLFSFMR